jgi:ectoine hydroxylase-related dioxygenase (phytanoyl-CoA dioxygenase family)
VNLPRFAGAIESLVGPDPYFDHYCAHQVSPGEIRHADLHQDAEFDTRFNAFDIQYSIFFHDVTKEMGGTLFVPGTHFRPVRVFGIRRYHHIMGSVPSVAKGGTVIFWHHNLWHSARSNRTDKLRTMFKTRLNPSVPQVQLWDTSDLQDPQIRSILSRGQPWMAHEQRAEIINRIKLWRALTGDPEYDITGWVTRAERGTF